MITILLHKYSYKNKETCVVFQKVYFFDYQMASVGSPGRILNKGMVSKIGFNFQHGGSCNPFGFLK